VPILTVTLRSAYLAQTLPQIAGIGNAAGNLDTVHKRR
jgi:hypothetical protein